MNRSAAPDRNPVEEVLRYAVAIGATLVLVLPAARGGSAVGWLPLWLMGMPLCAWVCLRLATRLERGLVPTGSAARARARPAARPRSPAVQPAYRRRHIPAARRRAARAA